MEKKLIFAEIFQNVSSHTFRMLTHFEDGVLLEVTKQAEKNTTLNRLFEKSVLPGGINSKEHPNHCVVTLGKIRKPIDMAGGGKRKAMFVKRMYAKSFIKRFALKKKPTGELADFWQSQTLFDMVSVNYYRKGLDRWVYS